MNSWMQGLGSVSAGRDTGNALPVAAEPAWLVTADAVIWWTGLVLVAVLVGVWLARSRRDPLAVSEPRPNRLLPEYLLALMVGYVALSMVVAWAADAISSEAPGEGPDALQSDGLRLVAGNVVQLLGGIAGLVMGARFFDGGLKRFVFGRGHGAFRVAEGVLLVFVGLTLCGIVYEATVGLIGLALPDYRPPEHSVIDALRGGAGSAWLLRIGALVVAPIAEECFFRGLLQTTLRNVLKKPWLAVAITAMLFGAAHSQQPQVIPTLAVLGLILGISYERSGSLVAPIVLHALFNLKTLVWEALGAVG